MAAAGTGLPVGRGDVASTIVDTAAYGMGEQAEADGFNRAAQGLGNVLEAMEPALAQEAKAVAEQDVLAGEFQQRTAITGFDQHYNAALRQGTLARLANSADRDLDELRAKRLLDPDGFAADAAEMRSAALSAAVPGELAMDWSADFDRRANSHLGVIRNARAAADLEEAKTGLVARIDRLVDDTLNIRPGANLADVMADPQVEANIMQITLAFENLANNPAFGMSREEVDAKRDEKISQIKAGAVAAWAVEALRTEGSDAALGMLQGILTDESMGNLQDRQLIFNTAKEAVGQELNLSNQRRQQASAEQNQRQQEAQRLIDEDVAGIELTGTGTGLTVDQVRELGGATAVSAWYKRRADAREFHEAVGSLPLDDPDAAAAQISQRQRTRGLGQGLPPVQDEGDLAAVVAAVTQVESSGRDGLTSEAGALGRMQLLPSTARRMAEKLGLPFDQNRLLNDGAYNSQLGQAYLSELLTRYNGDTFLAITAYHAGEGNVDGWLRSVGDPRSGNITREAWLDGVERRGNPRSAAYPRKVLAAMNAGRASAEWDGYQSRRNAQRQDPAGSVLNDFAVRAAAERWRANPQSTPAAQASVDANLMAQERAGVRAGNRRTLPNASLVIYAADLDRLASAGDMDGFRGYSDRLVRRFGSRGERVLRDVLEVRGDTRFAADIAARMTRMAQAGERPTAADTERAGTAARANTMARSAAGAARPVSEMTDEQLRAALGAGPL